MADKALYVQGRLEHHKSPFFHTHFKISDIAFLDVRFGRMHRTSLDAVKRGQCFVAQKKDGAKAYFLIDTESNRVVGMVRRSRHYFPPWWRITLW